MVTSDIRLRDYGMACYVHAQDRIGEVTQQSIEPIRPLPLYTPSRFSCGSSVVAL